MATPLDWFKDKVEELKSISAPGSMKQGNIRNGVGQMFLFGYNPKHAATLKYYDTLPLVFPFRIETTGFYGLNLHYLPYALRSGLINSLSLNNNKKDNTTRAINIMSASFFEPCIKHYLFGHVSSKMMYINPDEWEKAILLPIEAFRKSNKTAVWAESKKKLGIR